MKECSIMSIHNDLRSKNYERAEISWALQCIIYIIGSIMIIYSKIVNQKLGRD